MLRTRNSLYVYATVAIVSLLVWLMFRPLMGLLGVWPSEAESVGPTCMLQLLNAAYLLVANGLLVAGILAAAGLFGYRLLSLLGRPGGLDRRRPGEMAVIESGNPTSNPETGRPSAPGDHLPTVWFSVGLGLAALSLAVFLLGWAGFLERWVFVLLLLLMGLSGLGALLRSVRGLRDETVAKVGEARGGSNEQVADGGDKRVGAAGRECSTRRSAWRGGRSGGSRAGDGDGPRAGRSGRQRASRSVAEELDGDGGALSADGKVRPSARGRWLGLLIIPLAMLTLMAAMVPAGVLWAHDGKGYDVLEYHLQLPREYWQAGRVEPVDHNVFSAMPGNAEMLYLLAIVLKGDPIEGMYLGQLLNVALAGLLILGTYVMLRGYSSAGAIAAAVIVAGPQLFFVATNAYVECYMLLMFMLAVGATGVIGDGGIRRGLLNNGDSDEAGADSSCLTGWRGPLLAGVYAGAACGSKYTAVVMVLPVVMVFAAVGRQRRFRDAAVTLIAAMVVFGPWLIRNGVRYGNPVFPMATRVLGQADRSDEQMTRWRRAVSPKPETAHWSARLEALGRELVSPDRYATAAVPTMLVILLAGISGGVRQWRQQRWLWLGIAAVVWQLVVWIGFTHLQSRFLLPIVVPVAMLIAGCWPGLTRRRLGHIGGLVAAAAVAVTTLTCAAAYNSSTAPVGSNAGFMPLVGQDTVVAAQYPFGSEETTPPVDGMPGGDTRILLIGEARPFYVRGEYVYNTVFDRCLLGEMIAAEGTDAAVRWLGDEGITHVYVNWLEVDRLRRSYGFSEAINEFSFRAMREAGMRLLWSDGPAGAFQLYAVPQANGLDRR